MKTRTITVRSRSFGPYRKVTMSVRDERWFRRDLRNGQVQLDKVTEWHLRLECGHSVRRTDRNPCATRAPKRVRCDECPAKIEVLA